MSKRHGMRGARTTGVAGEVQDIPRSKVRTMDPTRKQDYVVSLEKKEPEPERMILAQQRADMFLDLQRITEFSDTLRATTARPAQVNVALSGANRATSVATIADQMFNAVLAEPEIIYGSVIEDHGRFDHSRSSTELQQDLSAYEVRINNELTSGSVDETADQIERAAGMAVRAMRPMLTRRITMQRSRPSVETYNDVRHMQTAIRVEFPQRRLVVTGIGTTLQLLKAAARDVQAAIGDQSADIVRQIEMFYPGYAVRDVYPLCIGNTERMICIAESAPSRGVVVSMAAARDTYEQALMFDGEADLSEKIGTIMQHIRRTDREN